MNSRTAHSVAGLLEGRRICLITSGNPGSNPRLVKEANTLCNAGARVMVIAELTSLNPTLLERTADVRKNTAWEYREVKSTGLQGKLYRRVSKTIGRLLHAIGMRFALAENLCFDPLIPSLAHKALQWKADLYIAHNLAALPAASQAAQVHGARLGFDAEDFHSGQFPVAESGTFIARLTVCIEKKYLPKCDYVTAASPGIAQAYSQLCGIPLPTVILNVFPLSQAPPTQQMNGGNFPATLYWFSQTIGAGRGLEVVIAAVLTARTNIVLYLQGGMATGFLETLHARFDKHALDSHVRILDPAPPNLLAHECARYDAGVAPEISSIDLNHDIALSNKIFTYMLAGVAIVASDTSAQQKLASESDGAILLYPQDDVAALATVLDSLFSSRVRLMAQRKKSWDEARLKYNWDREQSKFLRVVRACIEGGAGPG